MKDRAKPRAKRDAQYARHLFAELGEGMRALEEERFGKRTLRTHPQNKVGERLMNDDVISLFEIELDESGLAVAMEKHRLVPPGEVTEADLDLYRHCSTD